MKTTILMTIVCLMVALTGCANGKAENSRQTKTDGVEIILFHGKQRCLTCRAIEQGVREMMATVFAKNKNIAFRIVDFSKEENEQQAKQYKVVFTSLFIVSSGKKENLTNFAFSKARTNPDEFKRELKVKVMRMLK